jgi:heme exporter protein B
MAKYFLMMRKDLWLDPDSRATWIAMGTVCTLIAVLGALSSPDAGLHTVSPIRMSGMMWTGFAFAGMLGVGRTIELESTHDTLTGLTVAGMTPNVVLMGKMTVAFVSLLSMALVTTPVFFLLLQERLPKHWDLALATLSLATLGFSSIGTFLALLNSRMDRGGFLLASLLLPLELPILIFALKATQSVLAAHVSVWWTWTRPLVAYDIIFFGLPMIFCEYLWEV